MISFKLLVFAALVAVTFSHHLHHEGLLQAKVLGNHHHKVHSNGGGLIKIGGSTVVDREEKEGSGIEGNSNSDGGSGEEQHLFRRKVVITPRGDSGNGNNEEAGKSVRVRVNGFGNLKRKALYSIGFLGHGIREDHRASSIFKKLSTRSKASSVGDVLDVYLTGAFGAGEIIDSWVPGLGKLFSSAALASAKVNFCLGGSKVRHSRPETICSHKYDSNWGFKTEQETPFNSAKDYITAYGLDDGLVKFKKLLSTHAKVELSSLSGSQRIVAQAILDLFQNGRFSNNYSWSKKDVSFVFSRVITVLAALGSSYHRNVGTIIIDDLCDYSSGIGNENNGLKLFELKDELRKSIANANSNRWKHVINKCSDEDFHKIAQEQGDDDEELSPGSNTPQDKRRPNTPKDDDDNDGNDDRGDIDRKKNDKKRKHDNNKNVEIDVETIDTKNRSDDDDNDDRDGSQPDSPRKTTTKETKTQKTPNTKKPKQKPLISLRIFWSGIRGDHIASPIFRKLSKKPKPTKVGDVLDVYLTGAFGAGTIIDSWAPGLGKLFSSLAIVSTKINYCSNNGVFRVPSTLLGSICTDKYGSQWGFKPIRQITSSSKPRDYITAYGLDDSLTKFRTLLKTHVKADLSSLTGSQKIVAQAIYDILQDGRFNPDYSWSKKDVSFVFSRVITVLAALGSSYHKNVGISIVDNLLDYSSDIGDDHNGLVLISLKNDIKKAIVSANSYRWQKVIKECSNDQYSNLIKNQDEGDDDDDDDDENDDSPRGQNNDNDKRDDDFDSENIKKNRDQKDKNSDNKDVTNNKDSKKPKKDDKKGPNKDSPKDDDDDDDDLKNDKTKDVKNDNNKKNKDDQDEINKRPVDKNITDKKGKPKYSKQPDNKGKQKPLNSFRIFWQGIKKDHSAYLIFRSLSKKSKPTNVGDVLDVYLTGAFGAGAIIDSWAPGLGKLFSSLAIVSTKINYCSSNGLFKVPTSHLGTICTAKYGSNWGFKPEREVPASNKPRDYIIAYGLDDSLAKFRTLLKTHVKVDLSSLTGSQKIVAQAIYDILQNGRFNPDYTWSKKDVSLVFSKVITILATLGSSYHKNVGPTIIENLCDYSTDIGDASNGLDLISLKKEIKEAIVSANSNRWQQVIKECSDKEYNNHVKKQNEDDDDDDDDTDDGSRGQNGNNKRDDYPNLGNTKNDKDGNDKEVKKDDKKDKKNEKENKGDKKGNNKDSLGNDDNDDDDDDSTPGNKNKDKDDYNKKKDVKKDDKKDGNNNLPNKDDKKDSKKDLPRNDNDKVDDKKKDIKDDKKDKKQNKNDKDDTDKKSPVGKDTTDKKPENDKPTGNKDKRKPLFSLSVLLKGIKKDHDAFSIFKSLSKKPKPTNLGDVLDVYLTGAFGAGTIIDSWAPGLGKLFSSLAIVSAKINYCSSNAPFKVPSSHLGSICTNKYGSNWGFKPDREVPASNKPRDYIIAYGLDDSLAKFRTLLKTHVKVDLSSLTGSQKIVAQAIYDILQNGRFNPDYTWSKKDVSLVFSKVITILATLGSSYHKNVGPTIIENLCDYSTDIGDASNGLDLISLKKEIKEAIVSANSNRWQQVIKECSDKEYNNHVKKQNEDDDDDDDDTDDGSRGQNGNNKRDDYPNLGNTKNDKDGNDKEVKKDDKKDKKNEKENKGDKKGNNKDSLGNDDNDDDDDDSTPGNKNKDKDDYNKKKDVKKDDKKDGKNNLPNKDDKKDSKKDLPRNDNDKVDDKKKDIKDDKKDKKQNKNDKDDTDKKSPVGKDTTDKKPENDKPTGNKDKRKPLFSLSVLLKGIKKDHDAFSIFKSLSKKPKPTNLGDVLDVYLTGAFGAGTIIDSWAPGLGKLFSSLAIVSAKINYCSSNAPFKVPSSHLGSICAGKYGSNWGFKPDREVPASNKPRDYIIAYGLDDSLAKFRTLLKTHVKVDLSSLTGSQKIIGQAIYDILQNGRFSVGYSWSKKDISFIFSKVITVLAALGNSYHKNLGPTIVENLFDYNSEIGKDSNGLDLISLKKEIKEAIVSANSNRWQQVIKECSDERYIKHINEQGDDDDDDDDDDTENGSQHQNNNNNKKNDDSATEKDKNIKDDINKNNDDRKDVKKNNKKDDKDNDKKNQDGKVNTGKDSSKNDKNDDKAGDSTPKNNKKNAEGEKNDEVNNKENKDDKKNAKKGSSGNDDNNDDIDYIIRNKENKNDKKDKDEKKNLKNDKKKDDDKKDNSSNDHKVDDDDDNDDGDDYTAEIIKVNTTVKKNNDIKENTKDKQQDVTNKQNKDNKKGPNKDSPVDSDTTGKKDKPETDKKPDNKEKPDSKTTKDVQSALTSFDIFWHRIKGDHLASNIFKTLATKRKSTKVADVLDVYLTGTFGAGAIIDSWVPGLGKLFSSLVLASTKINYCLKNSAFRSLSNKLGPICSDKYGSNWGFKVESEVSSYEEASDYITAYGLDDGLVTFKRLLKIHTKSDLSALVGSQKVVAQAIRDLFEDDRFSSDYSWTKKDVSFVFSKVITVLGALGSSYNPKFGPSLVDELLDFSSEIGDNSNGLVLLDLRQKIKKSIAPCQSHSWNNVIIFKSDDNRPDEATKDKPKTKETNSNNKDLNEDKKGDNIKKSVASDDDDEEINQKSNDENDDIKINIEEKGTKNSKSNEGNYRTNAGRQRSIESYDDDESQKENASSNKARDASESDLRGSKSYDDSASDEKSRKQTLAFEQRHHSQSDLGSQNESSYTKSYNKNGSEGKASGSKGHRQANHNKADGFESGTWNADGSRTYKKSNSNSNASREDSYQNEQKSVQNEDGSSFEESSNSQSSSSFSSSSSSSSEYKSYY